jgi:DNA-binding CsgD family transcriptional regulator
VPKSELNERRLLSLVGGFYDAAFDDCVWTGLAPRIAEIFDSPSTALHLRSPSGEARLLDFTDNLRMSTQKQRDEAAHWRRNDPWVKGAREVGLGRVVLGQELYPPDVFERFPYYQDWSRRQGQFHFVGAIVLLDDGSSATFGIHRPKTSKPFDEADQALAATLLEHYRRAIVLRARLRRTEMEHAAALQVEQRSGLGVLVVNRDCQLLHANRLGEAGLRAGDGIRVTNGQIGINAPTLRDLLRLLVAEAVDLAGSSIPRRVHEGSIAVARRGRLPLTLAVSPLRPPGMGMAVPAALIFVRDPEMAVAQTQVLRDLFGLTPAEAAIAADLAQGHALGQIARAHRITINTARTHLKRILAKTGTCQQSQAVALVQQSVAMMGPPAGHNLPR